MFTIMKLSHLRYHSQPWYLVMKKKLSQETKKNLDPCRYYSNLQIHPFL